MRARTRWAVLAISAFGTSALVDACSVSPSGDCSDNGTCLRSSPVEAGVDTGIETGAGIETSVTPDTGSNTPDAPVDAPVGEASDGSVCDGTRDPKDEPCLVGEAYGVFVAPLSAGGNDQSGDGTKAKPFATIGKALGTLNGKTRAYVCNGTYAEALTFTAAASIYGGFACPGTDAGSPWTYVGGVARVNAPASDYAVKVDGVSTAISIEDVAFTASDAHGVDAQGTAKSSIAALVNGSIVTLKRVALTAGIGADGPAGVDGANAPNYSSASAPNGSPGTTVLDGGTGSGAGGSNVCANGDTSNGGGGGGANGNDGTAGYSSPPALTMPGQDGSGGKGGATICGMGASPGANGVAGASGAAASTYGQLLASGWVPSIGQDGQAGMPGQGGGGGGGLSGVSIGGNGIGAGGDGGGAGGCGGTGGTGGKGGGGSIALASVGSTVILVQCQLTTSGAGSGGAGGNGENGQAGGSYVGNMLSCQGASGGSGAGGSGGGGGTGGVSVGILYSGTPPAYDGFTTITVGTAGARGMHGMHGVGGSTAIGKPNAGNDGEDGLPGTAQATLRL